MSWSNNLLRIRRFLRDPKGNIWADSQIKSLFNDAQRTLQTKTRYLEDVQAVRVPPMFDYSYLHDWEWPFLDSSTGNYQALRVHQQSDSAFCYRWEPQAQWGLVDATAPDEGIHFTHPFEGFMGEVLGDAIPLQFPTGFHEAKLVAWDREPIEYITPKAIQLDDPSWVGRSGEPFAYYRSDKTEDQFYLYPAPSSPVWDEEQEIEPAPDYLYAFDFEYDEAYLTGDGERYARDDSANSRSYLFDWETDLGTGQDNGAMRGMWLFELDYAPGGQVLYRDGDTVNSEVGAIADISGLLAGSDAGIVTDVVEADDNVLFIFTKIPAEISGMDDESDLPDFLQKYAEYGAIERAYMADTDGQIKSLQEYWSWRNELGTKAVQRFMSLRKADRDYRFTIKGAPSFRTRRDPRLPDAYPAVRR